MNINNILKIHVIFTEENPISENCSAIVYDMFKTIFYFQNGLFHRLDGPALKLKNGYQKWWIDNIEYVEEKYYKKIKKLNLNK